MYYVLVSGATFVCWGVCDTHGCVNKDSHNYSVCWDVFPPWNEWFVLRLCKKLIVNYVGFFTSHLINETMISEEENNWSLSLLQRHDSVSQARKWERQAPARSIIFVAPVSIIETRNTRTLFDPSDQTSHMDMSCSVWPLLRHDSRVEKMKLKSLFRQSRAKRRSSVKWLKEHKHTTAFFTTESQRSRLGALRNA